MKGHKFHVRRKIMENEENRGLIHKNVSEDQLESFCSRFYSEFSWSTLALDQERKRRLEEGRSKKGRAGSINYNRILCKYQFFMCVFLAIFGVGLGDPDPG